MHLESKKFQCTVPGRPMSSSTQNIGIDYAIRNWKKLLKDNSIIEGCYDEKFYVKPSDRKRKQLEIAKYKQSKVQ